MRTPQHIQHVAARVSHNNCPECRADCSRRFADATLFHYAHVNKYLTYVRPRLAAIRDGNQTGDARIWHRGFMAALHNRISSHIAGQDGRKHAPDYAKYHLATYGNDRRFLNNY